jgi:predicted phosphodiesterase
MTIALIADIHGNLPALRAVLDDIDRGPARQIVFLGDVAGYYAQLDECVDLLRARGITGVRGNHDTYILHDIPCPRSDSANRCLDHQRARLRPETRQWLGSLALSATVDGVSVVHAGWQDPLDEYLTPSDAYFHDLPGRVFASAHTHVQYVWRGDRVLYCNPGSVGQPRDGNPDAAYALWDGQGFALRRVPYPIGLTEAAMQAAGFSDYFYRNLRAGSRIGGKIDSPPAPAAPAAL